MFFFLSRVLKYELCWRVFRLDFDVFDYFVGIDSPLDLSCWSWWVVLRCQLIAIGFHAGVFRVLIETEGTGSDFEMWTLLKRISDWFWCAWLLYWNWFTVRFELLKLMGRAAVPINWDWISRWEIGVLIETEGTGSDFEMWTLLKRFPILFRCTRLPNSNWFIIIFAPLKSAARPEAPRLPSHSA